MSYRSSPTFRAWSFIIFQFIDLIFVRPLTHFLVSLSPIRFTR